MIPEKIVHASPQTAPLDEDAAIAALPGKTPWLRILLGLAVLYAVFTLGAWAATRSPKPPPSGAFKGTNTTGAPPLLVHIAGHVRHPGVYSLPPSARVRDAIHKAGGPLKDADINAVNLAAWVEDGIRIEVPRKQSARPAAVAPPPLDPKAVVAEVKAEVRQAVAAELRDAIAQARTEARALSTAPGAAARAARPVRRDAKRDRLPNGVPRATTASGHQSANASPEYLARNPRESVLRF